MTTAKIWLSILTLLTLPVLQSHAQPSSQMNSTVANLAPLSTGERTPFALDFATRSRSFILQRRRNPVTAASLLAILSERQYGRRFGHDLDDSTEHLEIEPYHLGPDSLSVAGGVGRVVEAESLLYNDYRMCSYNIGQECVDTDLNASMTLSNKSLAASIRGTLRGSGIGDLSAIYLYIFSNRGSQNQDDEGSHAITIQNSEGENGVVPTAILLQKGAAANSYHIKPLTGKGQMGPGHFLIQTRHANGASAATIIGDASEITNDGTGNIVGNWTVTPSYAIGRCVAGFTPVPNGDQAQRRSCKLTGIRGTFNSAHPVCLVDLQRTEQAAVLSMGHKDANGDQVAVLMVREPYYQVTSVYQDATGICGSYGRFRASQRNPDAGGGGVSEVLPLCGALDEHTLISCATAQTNRRPATYFTEDILPVVTGVTISRKNDVATLRTRASVPFGGKTVVVKGTEHFDGAATLELGAGLQTYRFSSAGEDILQEEGTATLDEGRQHFEAFRGAVIYSVIDPDNAPAPANRNALGVYVQVQPSDWIPELGGTVESPVYFTAPAGDDLRNHECYSPQCTGTVYSVKGPGISNGYVQNSYQNQQPLSTYADFGGHLRLPTLNYMGGPWAVINNHRQLDGGVFTLPPGVVINQIYCPTHPDGTAHCDRAEDLTYLYSFETLGSASNWIRINHLLSRIEFGTGQGSPVFSIDMKGTIATTALEMRKMIVPGVGHTLCISDDGSLSRSVGPCQ